MKIRRFYSKSMRNALKQVTEEFGNDAAILSSQKTPSGVEVIAALDYDSELLPESIAGLGKRKEEMLAYTKETDDPSQFKDSTISSIDNRILGKQTKKQPNQQGKFAGSNDPISNMPQHTQLSDLENSNINQSSETLGESVNYLVEGNFSPSNSRYSSFSGTNHQVKNSNAIEWSTDPGLIAMKEELSLMRSMMKEQLDGIGWERLTERDPVTAMLNRRLSLMGINQTIIDQLIPKINSQLDPECCWQNVLALLAKSIPTDLTNIISNGGILAFMGGAGTGKTTTIAKLAARYVIKHGHQSVALITTDNYRSSGRIQLQNFAKLLKLPVAQVSSKNSLDLLLKKFADKTLILIDTPGMNKNDTDIANQLSCLKSASGITDLNGKSELLSQPIKKLLLLPATYQQSVLQQSINLFKVYQPDSCILTKLDEATSLGEALSLLIENNMPVAYTTDGQKVPENIRVARNHHLVSKAVWLSSKYKSQNRRTSLSEKATMKVVG